MRLFLALSMLFMVAACGPKKSMVVNARDPQFYDRFVNPSAEAAAIETKLTAVKLVETGTDFPMRFALFDNHTFYYQVDRLGNGVGKWSYQSGSLELIANRPFFDLALYLSAAQAEGDEVVFRFVDRFGVNTVNAGLRVPAQDAPPLEKFTPSDKGI